MSLVRFSKSLNILRYVAMSFRQFVAWKMRNIQPQTLNSKWNFFDRHGCVTIFWFIQTIYKAWLKKYCIKLRFNFTWVHFWWSDSKKSFKFVCARFMQNVRELEIRNLAWNSNEMKIKMSISKIKCKIDFACVIVLMKTAIPFSCKHMRKPSCFTRIILFSIFHFESKTFNDSLILSHCWSLFPWARERQVYEGERKDDKN